MKNRMTRGRWLVVFTIVLAAVLATAGLVVAGPMGTLIVPDHHAGVMGDNPVEVTATDLITDTVYKIKYELSYHQNPRTPPPSPGWCEASFPQQTVGYTPEFVGPDDYTTTFNVPILSCMCQPTAGFTLLWQQADGEFTLADAKGVNLWSDCPPERGCTLTPGYWKTHSSYGPAPYDPVWAGIGENTPFFSSGQTYYAVMWTPPAGNAYYNLAFQYVATKLNVFNGASVPPEVATAIAQAEALFSTYTPAQVAALKGSDPVRKQFISLAETLDLYNRGEIGPGHCWMP